MTVAKNMSHNFQLMAGVNRQWQHFGGTWNPTDPARFIQPDAFESDTLLYMPRGNNEENSLPITTGTTVHTYGPTWQEYSMRFGGTYMAPWGIVLAGSYTVLAGPWSGPIVDQLPEGDPQLAVFGPASVRLANGTTQSNPLSTRMRFVFPTRGEGQVQAPAIKTLGLTVNKTMKLRRQPRSGARRGDLQRAERRQLQPVQLQRRQRALQHRQLPAAAQPAAGAGGAAHGACQVLGTGGQGLGLVERSTLEHREGPGESPGPSCLKLASSASHRFPVP